MHKENKTKLFIFVSSFTQSMMLWFYSLSNFIMKLDEFFHLFATQTVFKLEIQHQSFYVFLMMT